MIPKNIIVSVIVRMVTAAISLVASSFLCFTIWCSPTGLLSPYSRIIFGFSVADILQSTGMLLSPLLSPPDTPNAIFSQGTVASCEGAGFLLTMGSRSILWYILFLTYYFLKRVKFKNKPQDFAKCEEKFIFAFIWIFAIVTSVYPLIKGEINATQFGAFCMIASRPFDCTINDEIECIRGENAPRTTLLFSILPTVFVFLCLLAVLGTFTCYIYTAEKQLQPRDDTPKDLVKRNTVRHKMIQHHTDPSRKRILSTFQQQESSAGNDAAAVVAIDNNEKKEEEEQTVTESKKTETASSGITDPSPQNASSNTVTIHQGMDLTKQAAHQSILYILAFMLVYIGPLLSLVVNRFSKTENRNLQTFLFWVISMFYPIGGLLNMLIYTRPKVKALKKLIPQIPIPICLLIIILSGGEVPDLRLLQDELVNTRGPISSKKPPQVDQEVVMRNSKSSVNNVAAWVNIFGYDISSEEDIDLDKELDKIMYGLRNNVREDEANVFRMEEEGDGGGAVDNLLLDSRISLENNADEVFFEC